MCFQRTLQSNGFHFTRAVWSLRFKTQHSTAQQANTTILKRHVDCQLTSTANRAWSLSTHAVRMLIETQQGMWTAIARASNPTVRELDQDRTERKGGRKQRGERHRRHRQTSGGPTVRRCSAVFDRHWIALRCVRAGMFHAATGGYSGALSRRVPQLFRAQARPRKRGKIRTWERDRQPELITGKAV